MKEQEILKNINSKLHITELNVIQRKTIQKFSETKGDMIILSPTGSGKTLAFSIPLLKLITAGKGCVQAVIIVPSRELAIQIEKVVRAIANDIKVCVCYGGHNVIDETKSLSVTPDIIVATPGRLLDHLNRGHIDIYSTKMLVLDEFDKSLELGFSDEMEKLMRRMPNISRRILTSATRLQEYPRYLRLHNAETLDFLVKNDELNSRIEVLEARSAEKDKLASLLALLANADVNSRCIVFLNHRDAVQRTYEYLIKNRVPVGLYTGALDQIDREKAVEMFNNGSFLVLVCTDLGSRGLDITDVEHIIHYHLPINAETYTHRNGRTARTDSKVGTVHVLLGPDENAPDFVKFDGVEKIIDGAVPKMKALWTTLYFQAGRKEKISKGDVVGFLINQGGLSKDEVGAINSHDHYTLVAVPSSKAKSILDRISTQKIKNHRVRISIAK